MMLSNRMLSFAPTPRARLLCAAVALLALQSAASAAILLVDAATGIDNGVSPFATIQAAVTAASPGDTILVEAGTYEGPVIINKDGLVLRPSSLTGPKPVIQVTAPTTALGTVQLAPGADNVTVRGFHIIGIDGTPGLEKAAVYLQGAHDTVVIRDNFITAAGDAALMTEWGAVNTNITIDANLFNGATFTGGATGGPGGGGQFVEPNWPRSLVYMAGGAPSHATIIFSNNTITAVSGDSNNSNTMINLDAAGVQVTGNAFGGDTGSRAGVPVLRLRGTSTTVSGNTFTALSHVAVQVGGGSFDTAATSSLSQNSFNATYAYALVNVSASSLAASHNFWGGDGTIAGSGPFPPNSGIYGSLTVSPWYADAARTVLVSGILADTTIAAGDFVSLPNAYIAPTTTVTVRGSLEVTGQFVMGDDAVLNVIGGDLILNGSTLEGSFTFFNSFGSVRFNADTTITGGVSGLILICDVHVADGSIITIDGSLVLDGSTVDSDGRFDFVINPGASFLMARTSFSDGDLQVRSGNTRMLDNTFANSTLLVYPSAVGAVIAHNVADSAGWLTDAGTATVLSMDGWGNVTDPAATLNNLSLGLDVGALPYRTLDTEGNIYIQPGDTFGGTVNVSALQHKIAGLEMLLGYDTELLSAPALLLDPDWDSLLASHIDNATIIGKVDAAIGLSFDFADAAGSDADQPVTTVSLTAGSAEGLTKFFHRLKLAGDAFAGDTRLSTGGPSPFYLTPFTSNSGFITIDGTDPVINTIPANVSILQDGVDMTLAGNVTAVGTLEVAFSAYDALSGMNTVDATVSLVQQANPANIIAGTLTGTGVSALPDHTAYLFEVLVQPTAASGLYDVVALVRDRSGNETVATIGVVEIGIFSVAATVQLQGLVSAPVTRAVSFVLTDASGAVLETRTESLTFTGGIGSVTLHDVPAASARLSAKTAWNLRQRLDLAFDTAGLATASFTGVNQLPGGDLDGTNTVGTIDFNILRFFFNQAGGAAQQADIDGSGAVGTIDFNILRFNFNTMGDPL